jgi:dTDP-4-dehydrorhamnose reductase
MTKTKPIIIVTGANGQLGMEIKQLSAQYPFFSFLFLAKSDLSIGDDELVRNYFESVGADYCINCAAYTAVDKAETEKELAMLINGTAVGILAAVCAATHTRLVHISTDYVFDGSSTTPYKEIDPTKPVNFYGLTKLKGEELCLNNNADSLIIRTAWVYSAFGNNFVKTMLRLMKERASIGVVNDQVGSPTYAANLAIVILDIIDQVESGKSNWQPGIYHYSNEGTISWYDFALAIKNITGSECQVNAINTAAYPTPAKRPAYSVFDKQKIKSVYQVNIPNWKESLAICLQRLQIGT